MSEILKSRCADVTRHWRFDVLVVTDNALMDDRFLT